MSHLSLIRHVDPAGVLPAGSQQASTSSETETPAVDRSSVVLLATRQLQVRAVGTTVLRKAGFRVETAPNGEAVLAEVEKLRPDLILIETTLDDMSAALLCSRLRAQATSRTIPVLVISDLSDPRDIQQILAQDLTDVISAPVNWKILTFRIHRWIAMAKRFQLLDDQDMDFEEVRESALKASTELLQLRNYDSLTGLPNREMFVNSLELVVDQCQRSAGYCAVLYLDIDDFQEVNDLIGRSLGDELLRLIAGRLQSCLREDDLVTQMGDGGSLASFARVTADQFAILLSSVPDQTAAEAVAERLLKSLAEPLVIREREFRLSARIGIADSATLYDGSEEELLKRAEIAMRYCKQHEGQSSAVFESFMNDLVVKRLELKAELQKALEREELFLCYQLLVNARTGAPEGVEGLVRWNHPERGLVAPNEFLPVAEESDLIVEVDRWVLREGCRQGREWLDKGYPPLLMSLNVSMRFLSETDFARQVLAIVDETGLPPAALQLELSERGNLPDAGRIMGQFETLVDRGIHLALDDFGTGQTSLSYLRTLPINCVKVDQSFVRRVPEDSASVAIVTAIGAMSHHLGLNVVAEGVETTEHWRFLSANGYDKLQGYLFSKPERVEELETGLRHLAGWRQMMAAANPDANPDAKTGTGAADSAPKASAGGDGSAGSAEVRSTPIATPRGDERQPEAGTRGEASGWQGSEADLLELARNDFLTKLYNRFSFDERLDHAVAHADRFGHKVALLLIDLDDFKYINDTHGHAVGDELLIQLAGRLKRLVRKVDTLARIGGDEFAVIFSELQDVKHVADLGNRLLETLARTVVVEGQELRVTASLGISVYPAGGTQAKDLLRQADLALYKAKKNGGNGLRFFAREMDWEVKRRMALAQDLSGAVDRGELFLEYQMQVALATGAIVGAEALLRWDHPAKGLIGPGRLIPIAESTGEIRSIGRWVIAAACAQAREWRDTLGRDIPISVNLSPAQCRDSEFVDSVLEALKEHQLSPRLLHLELNERLLTQLPEVLEPPLRRLGELGVSLTLDNFGSGASALEHFRRFRFNRLKIHHSLVKTIGQRSTSSTVLNGIFALARRMDVQIVAEGVEKPEEVEALLAEGCEVGQGFLFSKPLSATAITERLRQGGEPAAVAETATGAIPNPADAEPAVSATSDHEASDLDADNSAPAATEPSKPDTEPDLLAALRHDPPLTDSATVELRKLDSYTATAASPARDPWRWRLWIAAMLAVAALAGFYIRPLKFTDLGSLASTPIAHSSATGVPTSPDTTELGPAAAGGPTIGDPPAASAPITSQAPPAARDDRPQTAGATPDASAQALVEFARGWARSWAEQRVDDYLQLYSRDFDPPGNLTRDAWAQQRRVRIRKPRRIEIQLSAVKAETLGEGRARVSFDQTYRSDTYSDQVYKILELIREDDDWKIVAERQEG